MNGPDFDIVIQAMKDNDFDRVLSDLKANGIPEELLKGKNGTRFSNWFSGVGASFLQLTAFLNPAKVSTLLELGVEMDLHSACA